MGGLSSLGFLARPLVCQRTDFQDAFAAGQGVAEYAPDSKAADEMRQLWDWINRETTTEQAA
jgi:chromosome partitioning protein